MQYDLSGRLLSDRDKNFFCELAANTSDQLEAIEHGQQLILKQIEEYEGEDWEQKFGANGLWRRFWAASQKTTLNLAQIDYYHALVCEDMSRQKTLEQILNRLDYPGQTQEPSNADLVIAKVLCALAQIDDKYQRACAQHFLKLKARSNWGWCEALKASMERIKCLGPNEPDELSDLALALAKSECKDDVEMLLSLAILERKYSPNSLPEILSSSPETAILLGELVLAELAGRFEQSSPTDVNLDLISPADAELAAAVAWLKNPLPYANLLEALSRSGRFQGPAVTFAAAALCYRTQPEKAAKLLIKASKLHALQKNELLDVTPEEMAEQAFLLAHEVFIQNPNDCSLAVDAFENYSNIASKQINEETQYQYGVLLYDCSRLNEALKVFNRLASNSQTIWRDRSALAAIQIELQTADNLIPSDKLIDRLRNFILGCFGSDEDKRLLRWEAMNIYCRIMLTRDSNDSAENVLDILETAEPTPGLQYDLFKASTFYKLGRLEKSVQYMSKAVIADSGSMSPLAGGIVREIIDRIELREQQADDFNQMLTDCAHLADFAHKFLNSRQTALLLAETLILLPGRRNENLDRAQALLNSFADENDPNWLRTKARLLVTRGEFNQSARLWAKIADLHRNDTLTQNEQSWNWWRAKYYELYCLSNLPDANTQNLRHAIEVLENTYSEIPPPWAKKLDEIKQQIRP